MDKRNLQIAQLERKFKDFTFARNTVMPPTGWIKAVRLSLGISLQQLANKLSIAKQSVQEIEQREKEETITLKSLREAANALDMELVYGLVPKDGTLDALIERKARKLATDIVMRTSQQMKLEDQETSEERIKAAIAERTTAISQKMPKALWD